MTRRIARLVLVTAALVMLQTCQVVDAFGRKKKKKGEMSSMAAGPPPLLQATCVNASRVFGLNVEEDATMTPASAIELREDLSLYWHYPNETTTSSGNGGGVAPLVVRLYYEPKMVDDDEENGNDDKSSAEEAWVSVGFSGTKNKAGHDVPGSIVVVGSSDLVQQNDPRGIGGVGLYYLMPIPSNFTAAEENDGAGGGAGTGVGMVEYHSDVRNNMLRHSALEHYFLYDPAEEGNLSTRMTFELEPALVEQLLDTQAAPTLSSLLEEEQDEQQQQQTEQTREEEQANTDDDKNDIVVTLMYAIGQSSSLGSYHRHRGSFQVVLNQCWDAEEPQPLTDKQQETLDISSAGAVPVVGSTTKQQQEEEASVPPSPQGGEEEEEEQKEEESTEGGAGDTAAEQEEEPQPDEAASATPEASENANATQDADAALAQQQQPQQQPAPAAGGSAVAFVIHGTIAAVAFGILIPGAMIVAWFRMACPSAWVYIHVSLHGVGFLLGLVSIFIALGAGPWSGDSSNHATTQHGWMGLFVLLLVVFQIANGCLRPSLVPKHGSSSTHGGGGDRDNSSNHSASSTASLVPGGGEKPKLAPPRRCCPSGMDTRNRWYWMHRCVAVTVLILVAAQIHSGIQLYGRRFGPGRTREVLVVFWVYASTLAAGLLGLRLYFWCDQPPRPPPQRQQRGPHHQQLQRQESLSLSAPPDENNNKMDKMKKMLSFSKRKKKRRGDGDNGGLGSMHWGNDSRTNFSYDAQNLQMHRRPSDDSLGNEFGDDDDDDDVDVTDDFNDEALMRAFTNNGNIGNNNSSNNNMGKSKAMSINVV